MSCLTIKQVFHPHLFLYKTINHLIKIRSQAFNNVVDNLLDANSYHLLWANVGVSFLGFWTITTQYKLFVQSVVQNNFLL